MVRRDESSERGRGARGPKACSAEFAEQFKASFRTLWTVAVGIVRDPALAEDVVQDAAIIALGKFDQYQPGSNFTAWMAQMVRFVALNQSRTGSIEDANDVTSGGFLESARARLESPGSIDDRSCGLKLIETRMASSLYGGCFSISKFISSDAPPF